MQTRPSSSAYWVYLLAVSSFVVFIASTFFPLLCGMDVDGDASFGCSANSLPHGGTAGTGGKVLGAQRNGRRRRRINLRHKNQVEPGTGRPRLRNRRLGDVFAVQARGI